jgi:hypothetical protein
VLATEIGLGHCLDLLESTYHGAIRATYRNLRTVYRSQGWTLPKNQKKRHDLDCLVINTFVLFMEQFTGPQGILFQTVRGVFEEGRPLFPGSAIRSESHIQVERLTWDDAKRPPEEQIRDLIEAGVIDEQGRVLIGGWGWGLGQDETKSENQSAERARR